MNKRIIPESELILNPDGSVYHIHLKPEHVADDVIVVGDQGRVDRISNFFSKVEFKIQSREFVTHTGIYKGKRITVTSTGIGTDNIDIVVNELDAAVNVDLKTRQVKDDLKKLNIIRIGTSGALQEEIPVDSFVFSNYGLGFDGLLHFYNWSQTEKENKLMNDFIKHTSWPSDISKPYLVKGSEKLDKMLSEGMHKGITATANGFYGPQGRMLRLPLRMPDLNEKLTDFKSENEKVTNFEMETSALFGLGRLMGHECATVCAIIANRIRKEYSKDYKKSVDALIETVLDRVTK